MPKTWNILSKEEQRVHDAWPKLTAERRKYSFYTSKDLLALLSDVRGTANKVFFTVAFGYFKETAQFYTDANSRDIDFVARSYGLNSGDLTWDQYGRAARENHRKIILEFFGFRSFDDDAASWIRTETVKALRSRKSPKACFRDIVDLLKHKRCEIPQYQTLARIVSDEYSNHRNHLIDVVRTHLSAEARAKLDSLIDKPDKNTLSGNAYTLTLVKRFSHSVKLNKIRKNLEHHAVLLEVYSLVKPVLEKLNLNADGIRSFAGVTEYAQIFQVKRKRDDERYLHLVVFIANQLFRLQDLLVDALVRIITTAINDADRQAKEELFKRRKEIDAQHLQLQEHTDSLSTQIKKVKAKLLAPELSDSEKVIEALKILQGPGDNIANIESNLETLRKNNDTLSGDAIFLRILAEKSRSLEGKCKGIICALTYDYKGSDVKLGAAIKRYIKCDGKVSESFPVGFLSSTERKYVEQDPFNASLYKVLFFRCVALSFKSDTLNLLNAYEYVTLESNLISASRFEKHRQSILAAAGMEEFSSFEKLMRSLKLETNAMFKQVNTRVQRGDNPYVIPDVDGQGYHVAAERAEPELQFQQDLAIELYPKDNPLSLAQAIATVNRATHFTSAFEHLLHRGTGERPEDKIFYAGIMGLGCHIGTRSMAKHSYDINQNTLETTADTYFSLENVRNACDQILEFVDKLPVANLFRSEYGVLTSSDGLKYIVSYDSLNANFSFKYGGKDLVISPYTFIDSRNLFFHSTVFSGARREAHYMLDGVLRNHVVKSNIHTTDTHGYTEAVFGVAHLASVSYAPRLRNFHRQQLYSFETRRQYRNQNYAVLPKRPIKEEWIESQYETILRLVASIKLGETTASQVFKRLNSYSDENPLYKGLKEFGRIIKTLHLLKYVDDKDYRKAITKQLNQGELGNKLDRAIAVGNPEYSETLKESQEVTESCKRLIKNVIVCWNYMHLSQLLIDAKSDPKRKRALISRILETSTVSWSHFLLNGRFDFSETHLRDSRKFLIDKMLDPSILIVKDKDE